MTHKFFSEIKPKCQQILRTNTDYIQFRFWADSVYFLQFWTLDSYELECALIEKFFSSNDFLFPGQYDGPWKCSTTENDRERKNPDEFNERNKGMRGTRRMRARQTNEKTKRKYIYIWSEYRNHSSFGWCHVERDRAKSRSIIEIDIDGMSVCERARCDGGI